MKGSKSIPLRLNAETYRRLVEVDAALGVGNKSLLIKLSLEALLRAVARDGEIVLPMNWREIGRTLDGRYKPEIPMVAEGAPATKAKALTITKTVYPGGPRRKSARSPDDAGTSRQTD